MQHDAWVQTAAFAARWAWVTLVALATTGAFALVVKFARKAAWWNGPFVAAAVFGPATVGVAVSPQFGWTGMAATIGMAAVLLVGVQALTYVRLACPEPWCGLVYRRDWVVFSILAGVAAAIFYRHYSVQENIGLLDPLKDHPLRLVVELGCAPLYAAVAVFLSGPLVGAAVTSGEPLLKRIHFGVTVPLLFLPMVVFQSYLPLTLQPLYAGFDWRSTVRFAPLFISAPPW